MVALSPDRSAGRSAWRIAYRQKIEEPVEFRLLRLRQKIRPNNPMVHHTLARAFARRKRMCEAFDAMNRAVSLRPENREWRALLDKYHGGAVAEAKAAPTPAAGPVAAFQYRAAIQAQVKNPAAARENAETALAQRIFTRAEYHGELALYWIGRGRWFSAIVEFEKALAISPRRSDWWRLLATAHFEMGHYGDAVSAFRKSVSLDAANAEAWYQLSTSLERLKRDEEASRALHNAMRLKPEARATGRAFFHAQDGRWVEAFRDLRERADAVDAASAVLDLAGRAASRCHDWESAGGYMSRLVEREPECAEWRLRLGFALERQGRFDEAERCYRSALALGDSFEVSYRLGHVLFAVEDFEAAAIAWLEGCDPAPPDGKPRTSPSREIGAIAGRREHALTAAAEAERIERWEEAASALQMAIDHSPGNAPELQKRLGHALARSARYEEACIALRQMEVYQRTRDIDFDIFEGDRQLIRVSRYAEYQDTLPVRPNVVLYETFGTTIKCNPRAIFDGLMANPAYSHLLHVWVVAGETAADTLRDAPSNVVFVDLRSERYLIFLATARYLISNATFPSYFSRRPDQLYLNTWHGTPLKSLGKDMAVPGMALEHRNTARNLLQATHILSPNAHTTHVLLERNDIHGLAKARVAETGYPRIDRMINATDAARAKLRETLGLLPGRPVVLYAPTWRGTLGSIEVDTARLVEELGRLRHDDYQLLFRSHHLSEALLKGCDLPLTVPPADIDTYEILSITDVLVTDYSSIFFDFLPRRQPIIFYTPDIDQYKAKRGSLYFDMRSLPGPVCTTAEATVAAVLEGLAHGVRDPAGHETAIARFAPHEDGRATKRAIEFFFEDSRANVLPAVASGRHELLLYTSSIKPNGITSSLLSLLYQFDRAKYDVTLCVESSEILLNEDCRTMLHRVPADVRVIARFGSKGLNFEEYWSLAQFKQNNSLQSPELQIIFDRALKREQLRAFGAASWDTHVNFDGYKSLVAALLAVPSKSSTRSIIYLHNDMLQEWKLRFPSLERVFRLYPNYAAGVSVSRTLEEVNRANLAERFGIDPKFFVSAVNCIDSAEILRRASCPLESGLARWAEGRTLFVSIGRMSPEKDHRKLIEAFARVLRKQPDIRLAIAGDGPLKEDLARRVTSLGLDEAVRLTGQIANPFPLLQRADCFVLSSNHEGQPIVLLEALTLGKPIIATDIPGNRHVLETCGLLVPNDQAGLEAGLEAFIAGKIPAPAFDPLAYQAQALADFDRIIAAEPASARGEKPRP